MEIYNSKSFQYTAIFKNFPFLVDSSTSDYDKICNKQKKQPTQNPNYLFNHLK